MKNIVYVVRNVERILGVHRDRIKAFESLCLDEYDSAVQSVRDDVDGSLDDVVPTAETYELGCDIKVHTRSHVIDYVDSMLNVLAVLIVILFIVLSLIILVIKY